MITVVIETRNNEVPLAHALAALVSAATAGVVREVIVVDRGSEDGTLIVADAAGCTIVRDVAGDGEALRGAVEQARGDWLLFHPIGVVAHPGWQSEATAFIDRALASGDSSSAQAVFRRGRVETGWWARATSKLAELVRGERSGILVQRDAWLALSAASTASAASFASDARRGAA